MSGFNNFNLSDNIMKALESVGFDTPTEIQSKAIPLLTGSKRQDFHGQAQTGTGKTLAFGIPLVEKIDVSKKAVQALIIAPTRELVLQIVESLNMLSKFYKNLYIEPVYGGVDITRQTYALKKGVHIVVGTPGRLNDHIRRKNLILNNLSVLVLDEADIMLDMGFREDLDGILEKLPEERSIWLFSATNKSGVDDIKKSHMTDPMSIRVITKNTASENTDQYYCNIPSKYRVQALCRIMDKDPQFYGIIFCQTKLLCSEIAAKLTTKGCNCGSLHGDMDQKMRNKVIQRFKNKEFDVLVATDVVARGIDVNNLTHVINFSFPEDQESYIHRVGRTGRAGKKGTAITFISGREESRVKSLARRFGVELKSYVIPSLADIVNSKIQDAISFINSGCVNNQEESLRNNLEGGIENTAFEGKFSPAKVASSSGFDFAITGLKDAIKDMPKEKLEDAVVSLLSDKFLKNYKDEDEKLSEELEGYISNPRKSLGSGSYGREFDFDGEGSSRRSRDSRGRDRSRGDFEGRGRSGGRSGGRSFDNGSEGMGSREMDAQKWKGRDMSELILHVGTDDGFEREDIVDYFMSAKLVDKKQIERVRVIKKRSFVVLPTNIARKAVGVLNGKKLHDKKVRVSMATI